MFIFVLFMITLNIGASISTWFIRKQFNLIEMCAYWMSIVAVVQQVFTIITMNLNMITITKGVDVFWYLIMNRLILIPALIIWFFYVTINASFVRKTFLLGLWVIALSGIQWLNKTFGMISYTNWNFVYSVGEWITVISVSSCFFIWFRRLMKKEEVIV